ncbi:MAG: alkaline phosphatase PhoX [Actinomycetota bacterium]
MRRRDFLRVAAGTPVLLAAVPAVTAVTRGADPYGELQLPDANGFMLPPGFTAREIARQGRVVSPSAYVWHVFPDGGATFATDDGGWVYVSNSELPESGGVGAVRFDAAGTIVDAYPICSGTSTNCAGGATPWGTWLTCEEFDAGQVWECDPLGVTPAIARPALGRFRHEAVAVDPVRRMLYLTEDNDPGRLYRFTPTRWEDLSDGVLEEAVTDGDGTVTWARDAGSGTIYGGGEGIAYHDGRIVFTTKSDHSVRELDVVNGRMRLLHTPADEPAIAEADNVAISSFGDVYVCEDTQTEQDLVLIAPDGTKSVVLSCRGHDGSELAGAAFDPSEQRLYISSQRGAGGGGATYEVTGPFRQLVGATTTSVARQNAIARPDTTDGTGSDSDDSPWPAIGAGAGAAIVALGGLAWLRNRRTTAPDR